MELTLAVLILSGALLGRVLSLRRRASRRIRCARLSEAAKQMRKPQLTLSCPAWSAPQRGADKPVLRLVRFPAEAVRRPGA